MSKGFCLCGFYWYLSYWKLKLRNVLNVLFNLFKVTMMNPLHVNINNAFFMKNNYISQSKIKKWKECRCFTFLHISLTSGLRTAGFLFVLMHSIYYDMLLCLKYIKTIYEVYMYKEYLASHRCLLGKEQSISIAVSDHQHGSSKL